MPLPIYYRFEHWSKFSGIGTATFDNPASQSTTVSVSGGDATVQANFQVNQRSLTVQNDEYGTTIPSGAVSVNEGYLRDRQH